VNDLKKQKEHFIKYITDNINNQHEVIDKKAQDKSFLTPVCGSQVTNEVDKLGKKTFQFFSISHRSGKTR
jgi:hypothetical protein